MDGGGADGDGGGLGDDDVAMVEGVVRVNVGMSENGGRGGSGRCSADDDFGFARLRNAGIDDGEVKVLPFREAEPLSPQNVADLPSRSYPAWGAEKIVRSELPPWCGV